MGPRPIDAAAVRTFGVPRLGGAYEGRHSLGDGGGHSRLQLGVALDAAGERFLELEAQLGEHLAQLFRHLVVANEDRADRASLDHPPFRQIPVPGEEYATLGSGFTHQRGIADTRVIGSVVPQGAQPAGKAPDIAVGEEPRFHQCNLRIELMATPDELMAQLRGEASGCYSWSNGPGDHYAPHSHGYEKVLYCVDGSITFVLDAEGRRIELNEGDRMVLPAGTVHSAEVGPGGCTCIEGRR